MPTANLIVADGQNLFREGLIAVLQCEANLVVVGQAAHMHEIGPLVTRTQPDLLLSEIQWNGRDASAAFGPLASRHPRLKLVFLSAVVSDWYRAQARRLGARGYLTKNDSVQHTLWAIREIVAGRTVFSATAKTRLDASRQGHEVMTGQARSLAVLSPREIDVLRHLATGETTREVARRLNLSVSTVANHKANLMKKLDIHDRVVLARFAWGSGIAPSGKASGHHGS